MSIPRTSAVKLLQKMSRCVFQARTIWCDITGFFLQMSIQRTRAVTLLQKNALTTDSPELSERNEAFVCDVATVAQLQKLQGVLHKRQVLYGIIIQVTAVMQDYASHMFQATCTEKENVFFTMHAVHVYCFGTSTTEGSGTSCMPHLFPHKLSMWPSWWYYVALWKARWTEFDFDIQMIDAAISFHLFRWELECYNLINIIILLFLHSARLVHIQHWTGLQSTKRVTFSAEGQPNQATRTKVVGRCSNQP